MEETRWPGEWLRGALGLCVLGVLADGPTYGYAISQQLLKAGLGTVKGGTLYPLLTRLENDGFVESAWRAGEAGPGRKYFTLTAEGRTELVARAQAWDQFVDATRRAVSTSWEPS
jgi:PadR family transcriptional regulator PadR